MNKIKIPIQLYNNYRLFLAIKSILIFLILQSCKKKISDIAPINTFQTTPDSLKFNVLPDVSKGTHITTNDSIIFLIDITSTIPAGGVAYSVNIIRLDSNKTIFKLDSTANTSTIKIPTYGYFVHATYKATITVSSKSNPGNSDTKSFQIVKNLKSSYQLRNSSQWLHISCCYGSFIGFDYNNDYLDDVIEFQNYDINIPYTWPGPTFFKNTGNSVLAKDQILLNTTHFYASKIVAGDFDNNGFKDALMVTGMDPAGCTNCPVWLIPLYIAFNQDGKRFLVDSISNFQNNRAWWSSASSADIDKDGDLDIVAFNSSHFYGTTNKVLINDGKGHFTVRQSDIDSLMWIGRNELIDMNNDGFDDLIYWRSMPPTFSKNSQTSILWNDKNGIFTQKNGINIPINDTMDVVDIGAFDFDGDGYKELIMPMTGKTNPLYWGVYIFKTTNNLTYSDATTSFIQNNTFIPPNVIIWNEPISIADIDGNGLVDLVLNDKNVKVRWEWNGSKLIRK